ncbi:MAG: M48 family metalloprotease [Moraxellaceae bacterium]|nr:M48 family metalloprotease [Moraxellaceae bacterium]
MRFRRPLRQATLLALVAALAVPPAPAQMASSLPDLGDASQADLSPAMERRAGEQVMREIRFRERSYVDDPELENYLNAVGARLVTAAGASPQDFTFFALRDNTINAFAMPGGLIGVHTGLLLTTQTESELASVLGHEIGHIQQRHIARMLAQQGNSSILVVASLIAAILAARSNSNVPAALASAGQAAAIQQQLGFSRDAEMEADRVGFSILQAGGFDVQGMPNFFERMQRANRFNEGNAPNYLRTHPLTSDRVADTAARAHDVRPRQVTDTPEFALLRAKLDAERGNASDALARFQAQNGTSLTEQAARWYGLTRVYLRERQFEQATTALAKLREFRYPSYMVETLGADLLRAQGKHAEAARVCHDARARWPAQSALMYCETQAWLAANEPQKALDTTGGRILPDSQDYRRYALQAQAYEALGKPALQHRAQAELYVLQGALPAAIDQLQMAQRGGTGDFYEQSIIDARLRELRSRLREEMDRNRR